MTPIRTILCPVDLSDLSRREVSLAVELARAFGSRLVLQHNVPATGHGMTKTWEWRQEHPEVEGAADAAERRMRELVGDVPEDVEVETLVTSGPLVLGLLALTEELPVDLLVLGCHGCTDEEHVSLTETLLTRCGCPIVTVHEGEDHECTLHFDQAGERPLRILVPTDFSEAATEALHWAYGLAEALPAEIHLVHALPGSPTVVGPLEPVAPDPPVASGTYYRKVLRADAEERLQALVPEAMRERVVLRAEPGRADEVIVEVAGEVEPDLIVMGEHTRDLFRRFLTRDTARGVLHRAACPVWFVPPPKVAA